ncbi:subtilisin-like protease sbt1.5 [Quercus suber]|uniref:Subtilisin-like protease sbt1.5 n=1 Tax=Quercus suber TaxID=58331 RepID=A0AAW0KU39_QUESU
MGHFQQLVTFIVLLMFSIVSCKPNLQLNTHQTFIVRVQNNLKPKRYSNHKTWYKSTLKSLSSSINSSNSQTQHNHGLLHVYNTVFHGFSARFTPQQAEELTNRPEILLVLPDRLLQLQTTRRHVPNASFLGFAQGIANGVAPKSRIAVYKVCSEDSCSVSDILAGIDAAVEDGVDVISISIGGDPVPYHEDAIAIGAFGAIENGVLFSASGGNNGPTDSTISNVAPWITTVGASTIDRRFPADLVLGDGSVITGSSLYKGDGLSKGKYLPLIYAGNTSNSKIDNATCLPGTLNKDLVSGKIVLCDRGIGPRIEKAEVVREAGGVGLVLANVEPMGEGIVADAFLIPGLAITQSKRTTVLQYIKSTKNPKATFIFKGTQLGVKPAPVVASFSSRGPNSISPSVLKPDIIAPGVNILAAWPDGVPPTEVAADKRRTEFNIISGTSMSCPHVSGVAALLKGAHPDWSPAMIKSALMTTAYADDHDGKTLLDEKDNSVSSVFGFGAGHVDPNKAVDPGLVYDLTVDDYLNFLCASNFNTGQIEVISRRKVSCSGVQQVNMWDLNYPSISVSFDTSAPSKSEVVVNRTVTYVGDGDSIYTVNITNPKGVTVAVDQEKLIFKKKVSDILAGIDAAVEDGVDVISISIGGDPVPYHEDAIAIGAFGAIENGVLFSASGGNNGPTDSTISNVAPWITTVGASTIDRRFPADLVLGDGSVITGSSLYKGDGLSKGKYLPLIYAGNASNSKIDNATCLPGTLNKDLVSGKIVLCDRGDGPRIEKAEVVREAGGVGLVLANVEPLGEGLVADAFLIPGLAITQSKRTTVLQYMKSTKNPKATFIFKGTQLGVKPAPVVASFSSRGPNSISPSVLKPDIIAPGVNILAAWPDGVPPTEVAADKRRTEFNIISGTSMSCPHVSGVAALLKGAHPDWSPAMIKSALMTTAYADDHDGKTLLDEKDNSVSSVFGFGAGHVDPNKAVDPGLVYDLTVDDYLNFLCASNFNTGQIEVISRRKVSCSGVQQVNMWDLNYPSISVSFDTSAPSKSEVVVNRTVTYVGDGDSNYTVNITNPKGVTVAVDQEKLVFKKKGQKQSYMVRILSEKVGLHHNYSGSESGCLVWTDGKHQVTSPIVVTWS